MNSQVIGDQGAGRGHQFLGQSINNNNNNRIIIIIVVIVIIVIVIMVIIIIILPPGGIVNHLLHILELSRHRCQEFGAGWTVLQAWHHGI